MKCPFCDADNERVKDTRLQNGECRRVRECLSCGKRFRTIEIYDPEIELDSGGKVNSSVKRRKKIAARQKAEEVRNLYDAHKRNSESV